MSWNTNRPHYCSDGEIERMIAHEERRASKARPKPWFELELELSEELGDSELRALREARG